MEDYEDRISIIPSSVATHIPYAVFEYMDTNFFQYLCQSPNQNELLA